MDSTKFITPFSVGVYDRRESGKTHFVTERGFNEKSFLKKVLWINKTFQKDVYGELVSKNQFNVEFLDDILDIFFIKENIPEICNRIQIIS